MEKSNVDVLQLDATQSEEQLFNFVYITGEIPEENMGTNRGCRGGIKNEFVSLYFIKSSILKKAFEKLFADRLDNT